MNQPFSTTQTPSTPISQPDQQARCASRTGAVLALSLPFLATLVLLAAAGKAHAAGDQHGAGNQGVDGKGTGTSQHKHHKVKIGKARDADIPSRPQGEVRAIKQK